jgi:hypothetical protein
MLRMKPTSHSKTRDTLCDNTLQLEPESVSVENLTDVSECARCLFEDSLETLKNRSEDFFGSWHLLKSLAIFLAYF